MIKTFAAGLIVSLAFAGAAQAAPCAAKTQAKGPATSNVDPSSEVNKTPGAKAESPGTVGAMNSAGGGSFTSDGKPTQQAGVTGGKDGDGC